MLWVGADVAGVAIPRRWGPLGMRAWTVESQFSWAFALLPSLSLGGRHGGRWYGLADAESSTRTRFDSHHLEISGQPLRWAGRRGRDRLSLSFISDSARVAVLGDARFPVAGLYDRILSLGYGLAHAVGQRWEIDWQAAARYVWVGSSEQRQARLALRGVVEPKPRHQISLEGIAYFVHRDRRQFGNALPRFSTIGQFRFGYRWMSRVGLGLEMMARFNTLFFSGQAPVYEVRPESHDSVYGELSVGVRGVL